jgi:hypothetical protein
MPPMWLQEAQQLRRERGEMRCYFMRGGRIEGVTFLKSGQDDARLVEEARSVFEQQAGQHFDGFEVWDGTRFVYRSDVASTPSGT